MYTSEGSTDVKVSALQYHSKYNKHKKLSYTKIVGKKSLEKCVAKANSACDEAVMSFFKVVYFLGNNLLFATSLHFCVNCLCLVKL